jgi:hypothetical protein
MTLPSIWRTWIQLDSVDLSRNFVGVAGGGAAKSLAPQAPPSPAAMSAGDCLFISGATGALAGDINGGYDRTGEMCGGYALYRKRCDPSIIMEHRGGDWEVKPVSSKGTAHLCAYVAGGCAAEACTSRMWKVDDGVDGSPHQDAPSVKMVAGAEAQRQVERRCMRALQHTPPPPRVQLLPLTCCAFCAGCC